MSARRASPILLALGLSLGACERESSEPEPSAAELPASDPPTPPPTLAPPRYGDAVYLVVGEGPRTVVYRIDAQGWTPLAWPEPALGDDERLIDGELEAGPDGRLYLLSNRRVFTITDADTPALELVAELPIAAVAHAFAPGPGGELWVVLPIEHGQVILHHAGGEWTEIARARIGGGHEALLGAVVDEHGRPWLASRTQVFHGSRMGASWTAIPYELGASFAQLAVLQLRRRPGGGVRLPTSSALVQIDADDRSEALPDPLLRSSALLLDNGPAYLFADPDCRLHGVDHQGKAWSRVDRFVDRCTWLGSAALDKQGKIWVAAAEHLLALDRAGAVVARYPIPEQARDLVVVGAGPSDAKLGLDRPGVDGRLAKPDHLAVAPRHHTIQLASTRSRERAEATLAELDRALLARNSKLRGHVIQRGEFWVTVLGHFANPGAAEQSLDEAKALLGQGGIVRSMAEFCPVTENLAPGFSTCVEGGFRGLRTSALEIWDDPSEPETDGPYLFPPVLAPRHEPPAAEHPPAKELFLITASRRPELWPDNPSRVKYETLIWRPRDPFAPEPITAESIERHPGVLLSDGSERWELEVVADKLELEKCECDFESGEMRWYGTMRPRVPSVRVRKLGSEQWSRYGPYPINCTDDPSDWLAHTHLLAITGNCVFTVQAERSFECGIHGEIRSQLVRSCIDGHQPDAALFDELPSKDIDRARAALAELFYDEPLDVGPYELWPHHLGLEAVYPSFASRKPSLHVLGVVSVPYMQSSDWTSYYMHAWTEQPLPDASSMYPPPEIFELRGHKAKGKVVVGWSRTLASEADRPAPSALEAESAHVDEPPTD